MRQFHVTAEEATLIFTALNNGDPQRGLSIVEIRAVLPILDALENTAKKQMLPDGSGESLIFVDTELTLKDSEHQLLIQKLEASGGWKSADVGRKVIRLNNRIKELPSVLTLQEKG